MSKDYVIVTAISSHRMRYVMHKDDLRKLNTEATPTDTELAEWAQDSVAMQECEDFSQLWLGEQISDAYECDEDEMLTFFDRDNNYLSGWSRDAKIEWVRKQLKADNDIKAQ